MDNDDKIINNGWVKLYHQAGAQVTLPVTLMAQITTEQALNAYNSITAYLAAGFSVDMPGMEPGENVEEIGWVLRKKQKNDRGDSTRMELYPAAPALVKKCLIMYLDTPEQFQNFETACGVRVSALPVYVGKDSPDRGADETTDHYIVKLPAPAKVVWKDNPNYDPAETDITKKKPKRLFVRWADIPQAQPQQATTAHPAQAQPQQATTAHPAQAQPQPDPDALARLAAWADAGEVIAPGGTKVSELTKELLERLIASTKPNVTDEMKKAAKIRLGGM